MNFVIEYETRAAFFMCLYVCIYCDVTNGLGTTTERPRELNTSKTESASDVTSVENGIVSPEALHGNRSIFRTFNKSTKILRTLTSTKSYYSNTHFAPGAWRDVCEGFPGDETSRDSSLHMPDNIRIFVRKKLNAYKLVSIICNITVRHQGNLNYDAIRKWSRDVEMGVRIILVIKCAHGANITFPFPGRAHNVVYISIYGCGIHGFYSEVLNKTLDAEYPDMLMVHSIHHVTLYLDAYEEAEKNSRVLQSSKSGKCGAEKSYVNVFSDISYSYKMPNPDKMAAFNQLLLNSSRIYFRDVLRTDIHCNYSNLMMLDRSVDRQLDSNFDELLLHNSIYPQLQLLNYSNVRLTTVRPSLGNWRLNFPSLTYLDLSNNYISDVSVIRDIETPGENVTRGVIDVTYNKIATITTRMLQRFQTHHSTVVNIRHNPFNCNCEMKGFIDNLKSNIFKRIHPDYLYLRDLTCQYPTVSRGKKMRTLSRVDLGCFIETDRLVIAPLIVMSLVLCLLLLLLVVSIRYRKEIMILTYTRLHILLPCQMAEQEVDKEYDAFVSYSEKDADWVSTMAHYLEEPRHSTRPAFRLCLHHRDFQIGMPIAENIVRSIEASKHTILVLSRSFLESHWCLMEFRMAFHQTLLEKKRHLIIITREHGKLGDHVDSDLKRCLQTLTYIQANDRLFFDKMVYALSDKRKPRHSTSKSVDITNCNGNQEQSLNKEIQTSSI